MSQHRMNIGDIMAMREREVQTPEEATRTIRESSRHRLGNLAQLLECPFTWDDMVVTGFLKDSLEDFVFEARERKIFWEQEHARKLFPQGRGLIGLFSGSPGTGKTMAAQVIAANLGLDLFRIDIPSPIINICKYRLCACVVPQRGIVTGEGQNVVDTERVG